MRIGFDAKRAFLNKSGLGSYSRNLITALLRRYPENEYFLYTPGIGSALFSPLSSRIHLRTPQSFIYKFLRSYWRSYSLSQQLINDNIDIYHGLSHEIPFRFPADKIKPIVTIHDLIFMRFPEWYNLTDRLIYEQKFRYACQTSSRIIAISRQTASDITELFGIPSEKIDVIYQGCNPAFYIPLSADEKKNIRLKYGIPEQYILYIGTIEERKNLLTLIKAMHSGGIKLPLIAIGKPTSYMRRIHSFITRHKLHAVKFLNEIDNNHLPAFYQMASVFVYPSFYEGFGIPILEALASGTPVVTSTGGCFAEAGGNAALYTNPHNHEELAEAIKSILSDNSLRKKMTELGLQHASTFNSEKMAENVMNTYLKVLHYD
jgi:glycosyltransferase involved in cell wall biosynthesis